MRCRFPWRPIFELHVVAPSRMLAGNASANVCRIDRADARSASPRAHPIVAEIHGYRTSFLNDCRRGRLRIQASTVISHDMSDRTACRASCVNIAKSIARCGVESGCDDEKMGAPPAVRKMHRLAGASSVASPSGCSGS